MEIIKEHIGTVNTFFYGIKMILGGKFRAKHTTLEEDFFDLNIPTIQDDRINMRKDVKAIGNDMKKALKEKQQELSEK